MAVLPWVCRSCTRRILAGRPSKARVVRTKPDYDRRHLPRSYATAVEAQQKIIWGDWFDSAAPCNLSTSGAAVHDRERKSYHGRAHRGWTPPIRLRSSFAPQVQVVQQKPPRPISPGNELPIIAIYTQPEEIHMQDEQWVQENFDYPLPEDYPWAPDDIFSSSTFDALKDAFELVRPDALVIHTRFRIVRHEREQYWRHHLIANFRDGSRDPIRVYGEGFNKSTAARSSYMQMIAILHTEQSLKGPDTSSNLKSIVQASEPEVGVQDRNVKLQIFNYAAHFGVIPRIDISSNAEEEPDNWLVTITAETSPEMQVFGSGSAQLLKDAEYIACVEFKRHAESLQSSDGPSVIDLQDLRFANIDNARTLLSIFAARYPMCKLQKDVRTSPLPDGVFAWSASYTLDGVTLGEPVTMAAKDQAERLASLVAAVILTHRHSDLMIEYNRARKQARGLRVLARTPTEAPGFDQISSSVDVVLESLRRSNLLHADQEIVDSPVTASPGTSASRALLGHFHQRNEAHSYRVSLEARSENLRVSQEYYWYNPSLDGIKTERLGLPVSQHRDEILSAITNNPYSIIVGSTGSGKSTQIPQIILEDAIDRQQGARCNIICTQPRRVAAQALARRVAAERDESLGDVAGYQVSGEYLVAGLGGSITYCTPELLALQLEIDEKLVMDGVSHLIVDEAHQQDRHTDRLITLLKKAVQNRHLRGQSAPKIVIMSATLHTARLQEYFKMDGLEITPDIPILSVPGRLHPVREVYLNEVLAELEQTFSHAEIEKLLDNDVTRDFFKGDSALLNNTDEGLDTDVGTPSTAIQWSSFLEEAEAYTGISPALVAATIGHALQSSEDGDILAFLPGLRSLLRAREQLDRHADILFRDTPEYKIQILHSSISDAVEEALAPSVPGQRRIFLATNIAETSLTFSNVSHVIDSGLRRERVRQPLYGVDVLDEKWISQASATQRAGRAGRVRPGQYYALYSKERRDTFVSTQSSFSSTPLQLMRPALRALPFGVSPQDYFKMAFTQPNPNDVEAAVSELQNMRALTRSHELTHLGRLLSMIPLTPPTAMLILLGMMFECLEPLLIIAVSLNENQLFMRGNDQHSTRRAQTMRLFYSRGTYSDHISIINAYREIRQMREDRGDERASEWAKNSFIDYERFLALDRQVQTMPKILDNVGILTRSFRSYNRRADDNDLVMSLITAATYPNIAVHTGRTNFSSPFGVTAQPSKYSNIYLQYTASGARVNKANPLSNSIVCFSDYQHLRHDYATMANLSRTSPLALALFGAQDVELKVGSDNVVILDKWFTIQLKSHNVAKTLIRLKSGWANVWLDWIQDISKVRAPGIQASRRRKAQVEFTQSVVDLLHLERHGTDPSGLEVDTVGSDHHAPLIALETSRCQEAFDQVDATRSRDAFDEMDDLEGTGQREERERQLAEDDVSEDPWATGSSNQNTGDDDAETDGNWAHLPHEA